MNEEKLRISKIDAARRQLDCAIELWFFDKDEISIHTLAAAAYQIIHDLKVHKGIVRDLLYDSAMIKDEYRNDWINVLKRPVNFFKHADNDPAGTVEFSPFGNLVFLMFSAGGLKLLGEQSSHAVNALVFWLTLHQPELITPEYRKLFADRIDIQTLQDVRAIPKADFFTIYVSTSANQST
ncbi:MAG: hypothetical protein WBD42_01845 [Methylovirgula sp.]